MRSSIARGWAASLGFALVAAACACAHTRSSNAVCGTTGGSCSPEGATCYPSPVGTGWAHALTCQGGTWQELEIAPLPTPPPTTPVAPSDAGAD